MDPLTLALIFGAAGAGKGLLVDKPKERQDQITKSVYTRMSPWLKIAPPDVKEADPIGQGIAGVSQGYMFGALNKAATAPKVQETEKAQADAEKMQSDNERMMQGVRQQGQQLLYRPQYLGYMYPDASVVNSNALGYYGGPGRAYRGVG